MSNLSFATNELEDAVFSLRMVAECLANVKDDSHYWKWVIIALHNMLQGFMVSALCRGNDFPVIESAQAKIFECPACLQQTELPDLREWGSLEEWISFQTGPKDRKVNPAPKPPRLVPFGTLYKRIKSGKYMKRLSEGKAFRPRGTQGASVKRLIVEIRNTFIHFTPMHYYSVCIEYLPIVKDVTEVAYFLAFSSGNIHWFDLEDLRSQTDSLIKEIRSMTSELDKYYAAELKMKRPANPVLGEGVAVIQEGIESSVED